MNSNPRVSEITALLDALKSAVRDFSASEEKLSGEYYAVSAAGQKLSDDAAVARTEKLAADIDGENAALEERKNLCQSNFEKQKARINRAHANIHKALLDEIGEQHTQLKFRIQAGTMEAERQRDEALAQTLATLEAFRNTVAQAGGVLRDLEKSANRAFGGSGKFRRMLLPERQWPAPDLSPNEHKLFEALQRAEAKTEDDIARFKKIPLLLIFRFFPVWLAMLLLFGFAATVAALVLYFHINVIPLWAAMAAGAAGVLVLVIYILGMRGAEALAKTIATGVAQAWKLLDTAAEKAEQTFTREQERIRGEYDTVVNALNQEWRASTRNTMNSRGTRPVSVDEKAARIAQRNETLHRTQLERIEKEHEANLARLRKESEIAEKKFSEEHAAKMAKLEADFEEHWKLLEAEWKQVTGPIWEKLRAANAEAEKLFPEWNSDQWKDWKPPKEFKNAAQFARLEVEVDKFAEVLPTDKRLALPETKFSVPLALTYPQQGSILFETNKGGEADAVAAINNVIFRLLSTTPPGKVSFTIFDPVGLGQNFAALMHLADYEEGYINSRIWTQQVQFEEKLTELNEHMEKVIQMYLRNEYATIAEYNAQAGSIAEKYHFLVVASFPVNFTDTAAKRLRNIAANGARCGVYVLLHWDQRNAPPNDFVPDELRKNSVRLVRGEKNFHLAHWREPGTRIVLDAPPSPEFATHFLNAVGESSRDSTRVEVPFEQIAPPENEIWTEETSEELRVPIGRSGATKFQYLEIGKGTRQHALIAGKTGSGKSTLFHIIITNLALWCSPEQVEFYLVDFKKGVEFKCYANRHLPHAKVVAIESDRAFGLSVLERVDAELRRRGDLFRQLGVQDVAGYKRAGGKEAMPRSLLLIDEFQEFFTEEDRVSQSAAVLLDRIVRQGRAFGIHVLLGSQTLGGAYTLARATIGQMVIRIALQCNEADAYLIMDQDNPAPRLLTRPGEGIYNDASGALEGNSPFQAVWLPENVRDDFLAKIRGLADGKRFPGPFVFEGSAPADVRDNLVLRELLQTVPAKAPAQARTWLGAPNSIKGPTEAVFQRQSGSNLLIVGQSEERSQTILSVALVALSAQFPKGAVRFVVLDSTAAGFPQREFLERVIAAAPHEIIQGGNANLAEAMSGLAEELKKRAGDEKVDAPEIFVLIQGLQNFKKLRNEDEFSFSSGDSGAPNPAAILQNLISDGPAHGIHVIVACDSYNNVNRFLGRKALTEFEMRVLFQMSASDSASLIDSPDAS
ncbi:MAG TPA: FtsK/SpoIIIE domain-containing protein, partial [Candidatus Aquilonibacter sp.]|nr:FtsK/SpoIIIE domain-containing protein [Candidatus Aquilonibacter sp.]